MPQLILTPPTFVEGQTIEIRQEDGRKVSVFWRDEDTLVIDGDERPILLTEWDPRNSGSTMASMGDMGAK